MDGSTELILMRVEATNDEVVFIARVTGGMTAENVGGVGAEENQNGSVAGEPVAVVPVAVVPVAVVPVAAVPVEA